MTAKELRIGNWVAQKHVPGTFVNITYGATIDKNAEHFDGIPLTPEILKKCGFTNVFNEYWMNKNIIDVRIKDLAIDIGIEENEERQHLTHIKYIHQLQNLYFALTGEELEVKL